VGGRGCRGAVGWLKRESAGHLGGGAGMEGHGNLGELCSLAVPWARRGGEETDRWGQAASETRRPGQRSTAGADVWVRVRRERGRGAGRASGLLREGGGGAGPVAREEGEERALLVAGPCGASGGSGGNGPLTRWAGLRAEGKGAGPAGWVAGLPGGFGLD
jgi:hypothetical protein